MLAYLLIGVVTGARPEDLAAALVTYIVGSVALDSFWVAVAHGCQTVYAAGGLFEHSFARDVYALWFRSIGYLTGKASRPIRVD
jgi:hypothetical protein